MPSRLVPARAVPVAMLALCLARHSSALSRLPKFTPTVRGLSYNSACFSSLLSPAHIRALGDGEAVVVDGVFNIDFARALAAEVASIADSSLDKRGVSRSVLDAVGNDGQRVRGDLAGWFDASGTLNGGKTCAADSLGALWRWFEDLRLFLNQEAFLSLKRQDCQLARYPGDGAARYQKHLDAFRDERGANRQITAMVYLNEGWTQDDGGCLRAWRGDTPVDISPTLNRLVLFRSDLVVHEVLPPTRTRHAAAAWYYGGD